jgi:rsbT antagonist protein RsbS
MSDNHNSILINKIRNIILVPIPKNPTDKKIITIQERILNSLKKYEVKGVVLDISEVNVIDSFFARSLAETAHMINLMGYKTVLCGMQPSVAITTVELGLNLGDLIFAINIDQGFDILNS